MKQTLSVLFLMVLFFSSCSYIHNPDPSSNRLSDYSRNNQTRRGSNMGLPNNPDPNKCYVRTTTPRIYETTTEEYLTYSQEDADEYQHKKKTIIVVPKKGEWVYRQTKGCISDNPLDCQVWCFVEHPAKYEIIYIPIDTSQGTPFIKKLEISRLVQLGGLTSYEEIDCKLLESYPLPVTFPVKSAELSIEAMDIIDESILRIMKDKLNIKIEISSHTDSRGKSADNQLLSEQRAQSIVNYLKDNGIAAEYLKAVGFGEKRLKNHCTDGVNCTDEQHAINERIEFRVLNY